MDSSTTDIHGNLVDLDVKKHSYAPTSNLEQAIQKYANALLQFDQTNHALTNPPQSIAAQVLEVLTARDCVQVALETLKASTNFSPLSGDCLEQLSQLDKTLREYTRIIAPFTQSSDWRSSFHPNENSWWWFFKETVPFDWLCKIFTVLFLTIFLGLIGNIAPRFLTGRPDSYAAFAISFQSILTLLTAGGALTKYGQEIFKRILKYINYPEKYWGIVSAVSTFLLTFWLFIISISLPQIATFFYTDPGIKNYEKGYLNTAEDQFKRAIQVNADDAQAHFRLGRLYEDLQLLDQARPHYQIATKGNIPEATNNLARLDIIKKDYGAAISLLQIALITKNKTMAPKTRHAMYKNLGWARFKQENYDDAKTQLNRAIELESKFKFHRDEIAPVYCLLAQVMNKGYKEVSDSQDNKIQVLKAWNICLQANSIIQEEDEWIIIAQENLKMHTFDED
jgi:tetratricopeptide (TPR) repeat protein